MHGFLKIQLLQQFFFLLHMPGELLVLPWRRPNRSNRPAVLGLERKKSSTKTNIWQSTMQVWKKNASIFTKTQIKFLLCQQHSACSLLFKHTAESVRSKLQQNKCIIIYPSMDLHHLGCYILKSTRNQQDISFTIWYCTVQYRRLFSSILVSMCLRL